MTLPFIVLLMVTYLAGAVPWSVWLGKLFNKVDVRSVTDGNPGAANAFRVGGWFLGVSVLLLDFFKAFIPVVIGRWGIQLAGDQLFWIALMPTIGHAFSIFLGFRGGRALVTLFGVWSALTLYEIPMVMGIAAIVASLTFKNDIYRTLMIPTVLIAYLIIEGEPIWMLALGMAQSLILLSKISVFYLSSGSRQPPADKPSRFKI